jgi:hypothetical protein
MSEGCKNEQKIMFPKKLNLKYPEKIYFIECNPRIIFSVYPYQKNEQIFVQSASWN